MMRTKSNHHHHCLEANQTEEVVPVGITALEDAEAVTTGIAIDVTLVDTPGIVPGGDEPVIAFAATALSAAFSATYISKWLEGGGIVPGIGRSCKDKDFDIVGLGDDKVKAPGRMSVAN